MTTPPNPPTPGNGSNEPHPLSPEGLAKIGINVPGKATGPKTVGGKARSRANAVKHGMRCRVVEPSEDREEIAGRVAAWRRSFGPRSEAEQWFVGFAAGESVRLDHCRERELIALEENTAGAERAWFKRKRNWARRVGHKLQSEPARAFPKLQKSAFGCDWLIDRWEELATDIANPGGYWSRADFLHALLRLGFDYDRIPTGQPIVALLYQAFLAADLAPDPEEVDAFLKLDTAQHAPEARDIEQRKVLGDRESGRLALLAFVRDEQARLRDRRRDLWNRVDRPDLERAVARARTFEASPEAEQARRYESAHALSLHRALGDFFRSRRESERSPFDDVSDQACEHALEMPVPPAEAKVSPTPLVPLSGDEPTPTPEAMPEPIPEPEPAPPPAMETEGRPAPNERHNGQNRDVSPQAEAISETPFPATSASPPRPPCVPETSPERPESVPEASGRTDEDDATGSSGAKIAKEPWPDADG